jgi:hypothetical protein
MHDLKSMTAEEILLKYSHADEDMDSMLLLGHDNGKITLMSYDGRNEVEGVDLKDALINYYQPQIDKGYYED